MDEGRDRTETDGGGAGFLLGLLAGTFIGAALGMLFAPKPGAELRGELSSRANDLAGSASEGYRRASETAGRLTERGRGAYGKARSAVAKGVEEAQRYRRKKAEAGGPASESAVSAETPSTAPEGAGGPVGEAGGDAGRFGGRE